MTEPHWKGRGIAAAAIARSKEAAKPKPPRNYLDDAAKLIPKSLGTSVERNITNGLIPAIIIAQALDRFGEKLSDAAAISNYKRSS